jgi:hypothetical protein
MAGDSAVLVLSGTSQLLGGAPRRRTWVFLSDRLASADPGNMASDVADLILGLPSWGSQSLLSCRGLSTGQG